MKRWSRYGLAGLAVLLSTHANAQIVPLGQMVLDVPAGWQVNQTAVSGTTSLLGLTQGTSSVNLYQDTGTTLDMKSKFVNGSTLLSDQHTENHGGFNWSVLETNKGKYYVNAFMLPLNGNIYYGYGRALSQADAATATYSVLNNLSALASAKNLHSLTGKDYTGKKYYLGYGDLLNGAMGNEVKYDIQHTNDIFSQAEGGDYSSSVVISDDGGADTVKQKWASWQQTMSKDDMYVEYSSGHGSDQGLMFGVNYADIADNALAMPAKEVIVFIMACYSGNLVDIINSRKSEWQHYADQGRTLMVMASSRDNETSVTGPGTDPDQPNSPQGSAGSAFGHALWKALIGYADGYEDGVKDGFISLDEIRDYTTAEVRALGVGQDPIATGFYPENLIMNRIPNQTWVNSLQHGTQRLSARQTLKQIQRLDRELRVESVNWR